MYPPGEVLSVIPLRGPFIIHKDSTVTKKLKQTLEVQINASNTHLLPSSKTASKKSATGEF